MNKYSLFWVLGRRFLLGWVGLVLGCSLAAAAQVEVVDVELVRHPQARWELIVSLNHEDRDRNHFCDRLEGLDQDGKRIFQWYFYEPKIKDVEEDGPVRRRVRPVPLPSGVTQLILRAHCKLSGWGRSGLVVDLSRKEGPGYRIRTARPRILGDFEGIENSPQIRTWRKRYLKTPDRYPFPPNGPVPSVPPVPIDRRPQGTGRELVLEQARTETSG